MQKSLKQFDFLHERAGSEPLKIRATAKGFNYAEIKKLFESKDAIICIGLSHDDRGLLAWYKKIKPDGIIISIDLNQPSYLNNEDFVLIGDLQEVLPEVVQLMEEKSKH